MRLPVDTQRWRKLLADAVRDPGELCDLLDLPPALREAAMRSVESFPVVVPRGFLSRIRPGDPLDPLLRQVLPVLAETVDTPGFRADPVGDLLACRAPGMLQKYGGRALLLTTSVCAIHCRYCFRRHFPQQEIPRGLEAWEPALAEIAADSTLEEVLLSGGDPLSLPDAWLRQLVERIERIEHVQRLRIHTRLPIVLPERVTEEFLEWFAGGRLQPVLVVHSNHPNEIDTSVEKALASLARAGVVLLNQSVLLRGVNDSASVLADLSRRLMACGVVPYYLHQLDRVQGAAHFEVSEDEGLRLMDELRRRLPGYLVPRYVREVAGETSKIPIERGTADDC